jgi:putative tricarboxylic transport membrane protein
VAEYVSALEAMYETDAWEAVRSRNGWVNIWNPGDDFRPSWKRRKGDRRPDADARLPLRPTAACNIGLPGVARAGPQTKRGGDAMALDRWIALVFIAFVRLYGYLAFFTMDQLLPPFMQRNPVWPSTFPKVLSVLGIIVGLIVLFGLEGATEESEPSATDINYRRLHDYKIGQALMLLALMVAYALMLRPAGFLMSTTVFLMGGSAILGERKWLTSCSLSRRWRPAASGILCKKSWASSCARFRSSWGSEPCSKAS